MERCRLCSGGHGDKGALPGAARRARSPRVPRALRRERAGAGVAAAPGREGKGSTAGREGRKGGSGGRPAQHAARRPGAPLQSIVRGPLPCNPGGQSPGGRGRSPGQARTAARERREPRGSAPPPPVPPPRRRVPMASPRGGKVLSTLGVDSDACAGAAGTRGGLASRPAPRAAPKR